MAYKHTSKYALQHYMIFFTYLKHDMMVHVWESSDHANGHVDIHNRTDSIIEFNTIPLHLQVVS